MICKEFQLFTILFGKVLILAEQDNLLCCNVNSSPSSQWNFKIFSKI